MITFHVTATDREAAKHFADLYRVWSFYGGQPLDANGRIAPMSDTSQWTESNVPNAVVEATADQYWWVIAGSVFGDDGSGAEYMMELIHPGTFRIGIAKTPQAIYCTPYLALPRDLIVPPGWRVSARKCGGDQMKRVGLNLVYVVL